MAQTFLDIFNKKMLLEEKAEKQEQKALDVRLQDSLAHTQGLLKVSKMIVGAVNIGMEAKAAKAEHAGMVEDLGAQEITTSETYSKGALKGKVKPMSDTTSYVIEQDGQLASFTSSELKALHQEVTVGGKDLNSLVFNMKDDVATGVRDVWDFQKDTKGLKMKRDIYEKYMDVTGIDKTAMQGTDAWKALNQGQQNLLQQGRKTEDMLNIYSERMKGIDTVPKTGPLGTKLGWEGPLGKKQGMWEDKPTSLLDVTGMSYGQLAGTDAIGKTAGVDQFLDYEELGIDWESRETRRLATTRDEAKIAYDKNQQQFDEKYGKAWSEGSTTEDTLKEIKMSDEYKKIVAENAIIDYEWDMPGWEKRNLELEGWKFQKNPKTGAISRTRKSKGQPISYVDKYEKTMIDQWDDLSMFEKEDYLTFTSKYADKGYKPVSRKRRKDLSAEVSALEKEKAGYDFSGTDSGFPTDDPESIMRTYERNKAEDLRLEKAGWDFSGTDFPSTDSPEDVMGDYRGDNYTKIKNVLEGFDEKYKGEMDLYNKEKGMYDWLGPEGLDIKQQSFHGTGESIFSGAPDEPRHILDPIETMEIDTREENYSSKYLKPMESLTDQIPTAEPTRDDWMQYFEHQESLNEGKKLTLQDQDWGSKTGKFDKTVQQQSLIDANAASTSTELYMGSGFDFLKSIYGAEEAKKMLGIYY